MSARELLGVEIDRHFVTGEQLSLIIALVKAGGASTTQLSDALCDYVDHCRDADVPPERMIFDVKRALGYTNLDLRTSNPLHARVITECIRRYYADQGLASARQPPVR